MLRREEKKQMILKAAAECFSKNGYDKTTLDEIGHKVSLNKATLYYYYSSKDDLFCDVIYAEAHRFRELVRVGITEKKGIENKIVFLLFERTKFYQHLSLLHYIIVEQGRKIEPIFISLRDSIYNEERNLIINIIKEAMDQGEIRYSDASRVADVFLKMANSVAVESHHAVMMSDDKFDSAKESIMDDIRFTTKLIFSGISARP